MSRRALATVVAVLFPMLAISPAALAAPGLAVPKGFSVAAEEALAPGVIHRSYVRREPPQVVHIAHVARGAPVTVRAVLSNDAISEAGPRLERTSAMCRRRQCIVAVNADFALAGVDEPVGGAVIDGVLARTPVPAHHQLSIDAAGRLSVAPLSWRVVVMPTDLTPLEAHGVNRTRGANQLILYTPANGPATGTNEHGVEVVLRVLEPPAPLRAGFTARARLLDLRPKGNTPLPEDVLVLSGHGAAADVLRQLWDRARAGAISPEVLVRVDAGSVTQSVGAAPVLVRDGRRFVAEDTSSFVSGRHPRTAVGWTEAGDILLVTADGRQPGHSVGMTLAEIAEFLVALGAVEAVNLDGGVSTTFVTNGAVRNAPSDRAVRRGGREQVVPVARAGEEVIGAVERPVVSALVVAPTGPASRAPMGADPPRPLPPAPPAPHGDPASDPTGSLPNVVALVEDRIDPWLVAVAVALVVAACAAAFATSLAALLRRSPSMS